MRNSPAAADAQNAKVAEKRKDIGEGMNGNDAKKLIRGECLEGSNDPDRTVLTIAYKATFFRKDRKTDYRDAWGILEKRG